MDGMYKGKFRPDKLKALRKTHGFTLDEAAKLIDSSKSYLWELENGTTEPGGYKLMRLCTLYKVPCQYFYSDKPLEPDAVYGYCPHCGAKGVSRERRMDGNDTCGNGHCYPSNAATSYPMQKELTP